MPEVPTKLQDRGYVEELIRDNFRLFVDPPHWRLRVEDIDHVSIDLLSFRPPKYHILFSVLTTTAGREETLYFYEGVLAKEKPAKGERVYGKVKVEGKPIYLIDGFSSKGFMKELLEGWCRGEKWNFIGFTGSFLEMRGDVKISIEDLSPLFKPEEEATANYIFRCTGSAHGVEEKVFDVAIKRFLPRYPLDRGNREYTMIRSLPAEMVPKSYGGLVNHGFTIVGEPQLLALFSDFIEGENVGKEIWDLMLEVDDKRGKGEDYLAQRGKLHSIVKEAVDKVIFPLHKSFFDLYPFSLRTRSSARYLELYIKESSENLLALKQAGLIDEDEEKKYRGLFADAWGRILSDTRVTEIHGDLMWRQIIRARTGDLRTLGNLVILDLDEHTVGHAGKDVADLCAANRFIAEDLPCRDRDFARSLAEDLNKSIVIRYLANVERIGARWDKGLRSVVPVYLAFRHLHDAAYHLPIWQGATDPAVKERHKRYVDFSIAWFRKSIQKLEKILA